MGVMATYCQLCGVPVHHDHFVPDGNRLRIYRGSDERGETKPVAVFRPEHRWLEEAIGLRRSQRQEPAWVEGRVHDGGFDEGTPFGSLADGIDERVALHKVCFQILGAPDLWKPAGALSDHAVLRPYKMQLFDFPACLSGPESWRLTDPTSSSEDGRRNRERINVALEYYQGRSRLPGLGEFLNFLVTKGCTRVELRPDESPLIYKGGDVVPHSFEPLSAGRCADILRGLLSDEEFVALADSGKARTTTEVEKIGRFDSEVRCENGQYFGQITFIPAAAR